MYAYIEKGEIKRVGNLPKVWALKDGTTVSGFHLLDSATLIQEGWLPVEEVVPTYDETTEYLTNPQYEVLADKVIKRYSVGIIPKEEPIIQEPSEIEVLTDYLVDVDYRLTLIELGL